MCQPPGHLPLHNTSTPTTQHTSHCHFQAQINFPTYSPRAVQPFSKFFPSRPLQISSSTTLEPYQLLTTLRTIHYFHKSHNLTSDSAAKTSHRGEHEKHRKSTVIFSEAMAGAKRKRVEEEWVEPDTAPPEFVNFDDNHNFPKNVDMEHQYCFGRREHCQKHSIRSILICVGSSHRERAKSS